MVRWSLFVIAATLFSCQNQPELTVDSFETLTNFELKNDTLTLEMDLSNGPLKSITLPSQTGADKSPVFEFQFEIENKSPKVQQYGYKIFYQNASYKNPETENGTRYNLNSSDNFYGSWISDSIATFRKTDALNPGSKITISDFFTISGNPLNLERYFGPGPRDTKINIEEVRAHVEGIRGLPDWYNAIVKKAGENNVEVERQLLADAIWSLNNQEHDIHENQRWQNNPRVGCYQFMLVVAPISVLNQLPGYISDLAQIDSVSGVRMNPFYYFNHGLPSEFKNNFAVVNSKQVLKTYAVLRPNNGLYYDELKYANLPSEDSVFCSHSDERFEKSHFVQYLNTEIKDSSLHNIDLMATIAGTQYSKEEFKSNKNNAPRNIPSYVHVPVEPCKNAYYDETENCIRVVNSGNTVRPYQKENAGIEGRFGFKYGKFRAQIQFPEVLSQEGVWNGITCAYWLKFQSEQDWNKRDACNGTGYLKSGYSKEEAKYQPETYYTEIDIEIVKTSRYWPNTSYSNPKEFNEYDPSLDDHLIVTCTNWDVACDEPENFGAGLQEIQSSKNTYTGHRWTNWYKALTIKTESPSAETVGGIYYYEIDWKPNSITWQIGTDSESMKEIGFMDNTITKIPDNQMVPVMSQEFHYGHWWPMAPYSQGDIPYPASPISGALYEIVIE